MSLKPGILTEEQADLLRDRLSSLSEWDLRVLASWLWLENYDHDTSDFAGLAALQAYLAPESLESDSDDADEYLSEEDE